MIDPLDTSTLKPAREAAGMSRAELASATAIHETTILRIEKGDVDPRLDSTWAPLVRAIRDATARRLIGHETDLPDPLHGGRA